MSVEGGNSNKTREGQPERPGTQPAFSLAESVAAIIHQIATAGFIFEPWQIAAYVTALRTKPFVILAGVTGTGKSTLPSLVAKASGGRSELVPVRPDWTDSSEVLGYRDLERNFRAGALLDLAREAMRAPNTHLTVVLDEMNLAHVEQYLAEVLSRIEQRTRAPSGGYATSPLLSKSDVDPNWSDIVLPPNLALVGTVNMDESAHGFSRKVLDRAFTLELAEIDLRHTYTGDQHALDESPSVWPVSAWYPRAIRLPALNDLSSEDQAEVNRAIDALVDANRYLVQAQLQVGYRTRDEVALFVLHSRECAASFISTSGEAVDPLDLALHMKLLPRIIGGSTAIRRAILQLLGWSFNGVPLNGDDDAGAPMDRWNSAAQPTALHGARYPRTAARLCLMWDRVLSEGFTSYWL